MIAVTKKPGRSICEFVTASGGREQAEIDPRPPWDEPDDPSELDDPTTPWPDDERWDVFMPDDDSYEPLPEPDDFWIDVDRE